jgi:peptidoglycan/LPS O-acetylase OafA/YrhL
VEEQFYLLLPLLLILIFSTRLKQKSAWIILTIFLLTLFLRLIIWYFYLVPIRESDNFGMLWYRWIYYPTFTRLDGLTIGVAVAAVYRFRFARFIPLQKYANHILIIGALLFAGCYSICANQQSAVASIFGFSLIAITFGLFVLSAVLRGSILFRFKSFITKSLATLSYSLYLSHKGIIHLVQGQLTKFGIPGDSGLTLMICILACLSGAVIMRIMIEKPAFILKNRILNLF